MTGRPVRWTLAAVLMVAAVVDAYLAMTESVLWPAILAAAWIVLAAALISTDAKPRRVEVPAPRAARSVGSPSQAVPV